MDRAEYVFTKLAFVAPFTREGQKNYEGFGGTVSDLLNRQIGGALGAAAGGAGGSLLGAGVGSMFRNPVGGALVGGLGGGLVGGLAGIRGAVRKGEEKAGYKKSGILQELGREAASTAGGVLGAGSGLALGALTKNPSVMMGLGLSGGVAGQLAGHHYARKALLEKQDSK